MFVSNPRPGSSRIQTLNGSCPCRFGLPAMLILLVIWWQLVAPEAAAQAGDRMRLELATGDVPSARLQDQLKNDRAWLAGLPPLMRQAPPAADVDSLAAWRTWLGNAAAGDSSVALLGVDSMLRTRWLERGHLSARCWFNAGSRDTLWLDPGPRFKLTDLEIEGRDFPGRDHLLETWLPRAGDDFDPVALSEAVDQILLGAGEVGFPFARWVTRACRLDIATSTVAVEASLLPGHQARFGPISSDLPSGPGARFLIKASGLRTGAPFRHSDLEKARQRLLARDLYTRIDEPVVYLTSAVDTVGVHFRVQPRRKVNRLQVVLGLSRDAESGATRLSGQVDLNLPNMAGTGRKLHVGWQDDGAQKSRFGFEYGEPLVFGTPLDTDVMLDQEIQRDIYTRFRFENRWQLPVVDLWGLELGFGWDRATYPTGILARTSRLRGRAAIQHRRGDRTRSGWEGVFAIETARRTGQPRSIDSDSTSVTVSTSELGAAVSQRIYEVDVAGEFWLSRTLSLAGRASFRQIEGEDVVPLSEQFRFGGAATLRGYREDEFHGRTASWSGFELRIGRPDRSRLYTFLDLGYFRFLAPDPTLEDPNGLRLVHGWPKGYGLGLLARTPGGDISLAVGFPGTVDFDQAMLHVILLESF